MAERVAAARRSGERRAIAHVAIDRGARQSGGRRVTREHDGRVSALGQCQDDRLSQIARAAGDEDAHAILPMMFKRQTTGSVVCVSCGYLVGVNDDRCYHCGRRNPGLWGFAPAIRHLGHDLGFVPFVTGTCIVVFALTLLLSGGGVGLGGGIFNALSPSQCVTLKFGASVAGPVYYMHRWWTVLSASWLHGSALHILFNLLWIRQLAPDVAELYGPGRMVIIYTVAGAMGFAVTSTFGAFTPVGSHGETLGASAAIF